MSVSAENAGSPVLPCVKQCSSCDFRRQTQPACIEPVKKTRQNLALRIQLLQLEVKQRSEKIIEADIVHNETIELVAVDRDMTRTLVFPAVLLVHAHAD
jgi:hypothetical protein